MKIAILGTRGIPNNYGGFEQFAEYISQELVKKGHEVTVYNPHFHEYNKDSYNGVSITKIWSPENYCGAMANFIYDYLCLKDALDKDFDIIYECGYHSNALSYYLLDKSSPIVITNMDGIEWKRSKWNSAVKSLIKGLEKIAVKKSHYLISDNEGIQKYYKDEHNVDSFYISYGADIVDSFNDDYLKEFTLNKFQYYILIARLEPENNIEMILDGYVKSNNVYPIIVVGNHKTLYGKKLKKKYLHDKIHFVGAVYEKDKLDALRANALFYFHGHSVGGTNPSLLEAMASDSLIVAHNNIFNNSVLSNNAFYFEDSDDIKNILTKESVSQDIRNKMIAANKNRIAESHSWEFIANQHETLFFDLLKRNGKNN